MALRHACSFSRTWKSATTFRKQLFSSVSRRAQNPKEGGGRPQRAGVAWLHPRGNMPLQGHIAVGHRQHDHLELFGRGAERQEHGESIVDAWSRKVST